MTAPTAAVAVAAGSFSSRHHAVLGADEDGPMRTNPSARSDETLDSARSDETLDSARSDETLDSLHLGLLACCQLLVALVAQALAALLVDQIRQLHARGSAGAPSPFTPQELFTLTYAHAQYGACPSDCMPIAWLTAC